MSPGNRGEVSWEGMLQAEGDESVSEKVGAGKSR